MSHALRSDLHQARELAGSYQSSSSHADRDSAGLWGVTKVVRFEESNTKTSGRLQQARKGKEFAMKSVKGKGKGRVAGDEADSTAEPPGAGGSTTLGSQVQPEPSL